MLKELPIKMAAAKRHISFYRLMGVFILYKSYCAYHHNTKQQILSYTQICNDGTENTLVEDSGLLMDHFRPSYLVLSGLGQTLYAGVMRVQNPGYQTELLKLADGGQLTLQSVIHLNENKGVVIIVPGVCGDGNNSYIINTVNKAIENGYSVYVINHRGLCSTPLLTPLTYHGGSSSDIKAAIEHISSKHPGQPIYGVGYSLGSNMLGNYLGEEGENSLLSGAVCICCPFKTLEASAYIEKSAFGLISRYLGWRAKKAVKEHEEMFPLFFEEHQLKIPELFKEIK